MDELANTTCAKWAVRSSLTRTHQGSAASPRAAGRARHAVHHGVDQLADPLSGDRRAAARVGPCLADRPRHLTSGDRHVRGDAGARRRRQDGRDPRLGRKDEIGQMADTVQVFKDNMIEADRLRAETEQHKTRGGSERKAGMLGSPMSSRPASREWSIRSLRRPTEMQSTAQAMTPTRPSRPTHQATAVAASVEQASTNVQTVASATEELSTSVAEIGRQVEQSSKIAGQAVDEADSTNRRSRASPRPPSDRRSRAAHQDDREPDQPAGAQRHHRGGARGRGGQGLRRGRLRGQVARQPDGEGHRGDPAQIGDIQGATGQTVEAIRSIGGTIRQMSEIATAIASAVEEQGAATREIATKSPGSAGHQRDRDQYRRRQPGRERHRRRRGAGPGAAGELQQQSETLRREVDEFLATVRATNHLESGNRTMKQPQRRSPLSSPTGQSAPRSPQALAPFC